MRLLLAKVIIFDNNVFVYIVYCTTVMQYNIPITPQERVMINNYKAVKS